MIGYECFVGLITKKGDIFLKEAGNNCERGQEPLKYGMRLTQVSKCYTNPRFVIPNRQQNKPKATALPRWRERELNNFIDHSSSPNLNFPAFFLIFVSCLFTASLQYSLKSSFQAVNVQELFIQRTFQVIMNFFLDQKYL